MEGKHLLGCGAQKDSGVQCSINMPPCPKQHQVEIQATLWPQGPKNKWHRKTLQPMDFPLLCWITNGKNSPVSSSTSKVESQLVPEHCHHHPTVPSNDTSTKVEVSDLGTWTPIAGCYQNHFLVAGCPEYQWDMAKSHHWGFRIW